MIKFNSLGDVFKARYNDESRGVTFITNDIQEEFVSYRDIYWKSLMMLGNLQARGIKPGEELIFQIEDNKSFLCVFGACILGGIIPVPVTVGNNDEHRLKLFRIWNILNTPYLITTPNTIKNLDEFAFGNSMDDIIKTIQNKTILIEELDDSIKPGIIHESRLNDIAFIQFSSGSTGDPKGVILTHENLLVNIKAGVRAWEIGTEDSSLSWMPLTHDMGLIAIYLYGTFAGINQFLMPTSLFIKQPTLWLKKTHEHRVTQLYCPNFGYQYFLTFFDPKTALDWDLSCVRLIVNGAEPISIALCNTFLNKMSVYGLKRESMNTAYGLAEATVAVSIPSVGRNFTSLYLDRSFFNIGQVVREVAENDPNSVCFADVGYPVNDCYVRICDDENRVLPEKVVGYIMISGKNVTCGYCNNSEATARVKTADGWLNTGDLGFMKDGRLVITGRAKDIIFINGQNYYPHDIERVAEEVEGIELGKVAVCGVLNKEMQKEEIVLFILFKKKTEEFITLAINLKRLINRKMGIDVCKVVPVKKIPKTTSGKVQRYKLGEMYLSGDFSAVIEEIERLIACELSKQNFDIPENEIEEKLVKIWKEALKAEKVGVNDNFFELGGNSLKATVLSVKIHQELNVELELADIFTHRTIKELAKLIDSTGESLYTSIQPVEEKEYYPVSSAQKRLYILYQIEGSSITYNIPVVMSIERKLDRSRLEETFRKLIRRHETLRTSFEMVEGEPVQRVHNDVDFQIEYTESEVEKAGDIIQGFIRPFDLGKAPLIRIGLVKVCEEKHILMFDMHHIISDGTSMGILVKELTDLYSNYELTPLRIQYKDYSAWQNELLKSELIKKQEEYWMDVFKEEIPVLNMPEDYPRPSVQSFEGDRISFVIEKEFTDKIRELCAKIGTTLYMTLLGAYNILLSKYSGQEDIVIGSPIAGRLHMDLEGIIGMFVNTLAMRNCPEGGKTVQEFLVEVKENSIRAYQNQDYQFEELVEKLEIQRNISRNPLFDVMFVLQNMEMGELELEGLKLIPYECENKISKFDMTLSATEVEDRIIFELEYCTRLYKKETIERLAVHYRNILKEMAGKPDRIICEVELLGKEEKRWILYDFNDTHTKYPKDKTIHQLFEEQVERTPDNIAIVFEAKHLTYRELNEKANQLARVLTDKGIDADMVVGIMVERSIEMITGILAILKAGCAYLPLNPKNPIERTCYMLKDSNARLLLTNKYFSDNEDIQLEKLNMDYYGLYTRNKTENEIKRGEISYIIYTSGSTGIPKGVIVEHKSIINTLFWRKKYYNFNENDTVLQIPSYYFDSSVGDIFTALISGSKLVLIESEALLESRQLIKIIKEKQITHFLITPSLYCNLLDEINDKIDCLKTVTIAGEDFSEELVIKHRKKLNSTKLFNEYGPTENSVCSTVYEFNFDNPEVLIGKPISNTRCYILDKKGNPLPVGISGELYISGSGLARGYLNQLELTQEKFVLNPYVPGERMYRTGDLARWLPDGNIKFLGRIDHQVKIRGFRIELGEIESQLLKHKLIRETVVVAKEEATGSKYLCAYIVTEQELTVSELREHLSKDLPDYMIPSYFVQLEKLPLTPNGKVDRKALPEPDGSINTGVEYVAPETDLEIFISDIWKEVLSVDKVGIDDKFFDLGGNSLSVIKVNELLNMRFDKKITSVVLFQYPTIRSLATYLTQKAEIENHEIEALEKLDNSIQLMESNLDKFWEVK